MTPPYKRSRSGALVDDDLFLCANLSSLLPPQKASPRRQSSPTASQKYSSKPPLKIFPQESFQSQGSAHSSPISPISSPRVMDFPTHNKNNNKQCPPAPQEMNVTIHVLQGMNRFMQRFCASVDDFSLFTENPQLMARLMDRFAEALVLFEQEYITSCDASFSSSSSSSPRSSFSLGRSNSFDSTYSQEENNNHHHTKSADYISKLQFFLDQVLIGVMQEHVDLMLQQNVSPAANVTNAPYYNAGPCPPSPPCESPCSSGHVSRSDSRDETDEETVHALPPDDDEILSELLDIFSEPWDAPLLG